MYENCRASGVDAFGIVVGFDPVVVLRMKFPHSFSVDSVAFAGLDYAVVMWPFFVTCHSPWNYTSIRQSATRVREDSESAQGPKFPERCPCVSFAGLSGAVFAYICEPFATQAPSGGTSDVVSYFGFRAMYLPDKQQLTSISLYHFLMNMIAISGKARRAMVALTGRYIPKLTYWTTK